VPPPVNVGGNNTATDATAGTAADQNKPKVEFSKDAKKDYEAALESFKANDKSGWSESACRSSADRFAAVAREHKVVDAQWYRIAYWRTASETINYRRFFDVTDLVGVRVENPEVFEMRNRRVLDLINEKKVTGLRIDHIDGLFDPVSYLTKLQLRFSDPDPFYVVVEKILGAGEPLPSTFRVAGTTGYDFLDIVNAVFVDPQGATIGVWQATKKAAAAPKKAAAAKPAKKAKAKAKKR
jgi:maltooligosyltrehalose synthase